MSASCVQKSRTCMIPHAPLKVSNKDVIWTIEKYPMLNVTAINNSDSGGAQRVNQEFKTAPRTFHEYMPDFSKMNALNAYGMLAELVVSVSRFFMSDLAGAFVLQASIVKPSRLTEVPAAIRALDDAIFQAIRGNGSCPTIAKRAVDQFVRSRSVAGGAQLTGIALLACMLEALGISKMNDREIQRKCAQEGRFDEETLTAKDWNDALTDLNVDMCSTQPNPAMSELIAVEVNEEIKRLGRKIKDTKFVEVFKVFTESKGTEFRRLQRFQAAVALWFKEEITWNRDDLIVAVKTMEHPMCQRFIDLDMSSREYFVKDEKTDKWVLKDGCDPRAADQKIEIRKANRPTLKSTPSRFTHHPKLWQQVSKPHSAALKLIPRNTSWKEHS